MNKVYVLYQSHVCGNITITASLNKAVLENYIKQYKEYVEYMSHKSQEINFSEWDENDWRIDGFNLPELEIAEMELTDRLQFNAEEWMDYLYMDDRNLKKHTNNFLTEK